MSWASAISRRSAGVRPGRLLAVGLAALGASGTQCKCPAQSREAPAPAATSRGAPTDDEKGKPMNTQGLTQRIEAKDWELLEKPPAPQQAAEVANLLSHRDPEVRELAASLLERMGGPAAKAGLMRALDDDNQMVRGIAARGLHQHCSAADVPGLVDRLQKHDDDYVREQVALLLGKLGDKSAVEPLRKQCSREGFPDAKQAMSLALARLGDAEHRQEYLARLAQNDPKARVAALEDLPYLNDRTLASYVVPMLDDLRDGKNVGPSHGPYWIRVCDVAVNSLDVLLNHPFPFKVESTRRYTQAELDQAKAKAK